MSVTKTINAESITYCSELRFKGEEYLELRYMNTIEGKKGRVGITKAQAIEDGFVTEDELVTLQAILQKFADGYNEDKE